MSLHALCLVAYLTIAVNGLMIVWNGLNLRRLRRANAAAESTLRFLFDAIDQRRVESLKMPGTRENL